MSESKKFGQLFEGHALEVFYDVAPAVLFDRGGTNIFYNYGLDDPDGWFSSMAWPMTLNWNPVLGPAD